METNINKATASICSGSVILNSGVSEHVLAQKILPSLHRDCVRRVMTVPELTQQFRLSEYYCAEHGTKLEVESDSESDEDEEKIEESSSEDEKRTTMDWDYHEHPVFAAVDSVGSSSQKSDSSLPASGGTINSSDETSFSKEIGQDKEAEGETTEDKRQCKDCEMAKEGMMRCPQCDLFEPENEIFNCETCDRISCYECGGVNCADHGHCDDCELYYCGRNECGKVAYCQLCDRFCCDDCRPLVLCEGTCNESLGCIECLLNDHDNDHESYVCRECEMYFCFDCKDHIFCAECCNHFCVDCCKSTFWCENCEEVSCMSCREMKTCGFCDSVACRYCYFRCNDCQGTFCLACPPKRAYYCHSCHTARCHPCNEDQRCGDCGNNACKACSFACIECETVTCPKCTKAYSCAECGKKICADCQGVLQRCCCEKKGQFVLA